MNNREIILKKVKVHNLKSVDLTVDTNDLIIFTGVSGSGKSSLAFDTIYAEGQRRYVESLSTFARRQLGEMNKPELEHASGISPTISIEQKTAGKNPRSTVGTLTEIYDYLRVLYARIGEPYCPVSGERVSPQSLERIIKTVQNLAEGTKLIIFFPYAKGKKGEYKEDILELRRKGFTKARIDGKLIDLAEDIILEGSLAHDIDVVVDRLSIKKENQSRIAESLTSALNLGNGLCSIFDPDLQEETLFSRYAYSPQSGISYPSLEPQDFSFNSPAGMCERCSGLGNVVEFDLNQIIDETLSIAKDCCCVASSYNTVRYGNIYDNLAEIYNFSVHTPWKKLSEDAKSVFLFGTKKKWTKMQFVHPITGATWIDHVRWQGVLHEAHLRYQEAKSDGYRKKMEKLMSAQVCPECQGEKLKSYPRNARLNGKRIAEVTQMTVLNCSLFFENLNISEYDRLIADELLKEIRSRLQFLLEVGLHYLTLDRTSPTLSGGEAQRVRLASQIGCGLVGITYILDEPSIGLHPRDNKRLIATLKHLRDIGNTVIVVEHDEETIWEADRVVDFGPGAGHLGGTILTNGSLAQLMDCQTSLTADYLTGRKTIPIPKKRRSTTKSKNIEIKGASHHNLKNINAKFPLGVFIAVTGVSGSGKSSLISETLYPALANLHHKAEHAVGKHKNIQGTSEIDKVIAIDQSPIGRNPRSNPATYIKVFDEIRDLFAKLPESEARGYKSGRFSFNVKEGSCPKCEGMGMVKIDMDFMEDAWIECPLCKLKRFDPETLSIYYKGKNIYDVLEMEVLEALEHFRNIPSIRNKLETLQKVGMDYIKLGQSSTTLSGGEAQRIKLAKELVRPATGKTLYILDEPTTGLHFHDIKHLLEVLHALVDKGNTVLVIEHNMDVVKTADFIIDLGPEGGEGGGNIIASGKPEAIAKLNSPTALALHESLYPNTAQKIKTALERSAENKKTKEKQNALSIHEITIENAETNNLKHLNLSIPREKLTVCTGPSGSGKSSFAFDTIYAEGQRRYIESLSPYARQFVKQMPKPKVGKVEGLSPAIAIEQKAHAGNPRSTVGTMTEIYDYLRILYARKGIPYCPETGEQIKSISKDYVAERILDYPENEKIQILAPIQIQKADNFEDVAMRLLKKGFVRVRLNDVYYELDQNEVVQAFDKKRKNELFLVIDRLVVKKNISHRLFEAIEKAAEVGENKLVVHRESGDVLFNLSFAVESTGKSYSEITPHTFAFNTAEGMCPDCNGLGIQYGANLIQRTDVLQQSASGLLRNLWKEKTTKQAMHLFESFLEQEGIDPYTPLCHLTLKQVQLIMNGSQEKWMVSPEGFQFRFNGINHTLAKIGKNGASELRQALIPLLHELTCFSCKGSRLKPLARNVRLNDLSISDLCDLPIEKSLSFIENLKLEKNEIKLLEDVQTQLISRLRFLNEVGLGYLAVSRRAPSLSGGESQRIRLARQLGTGLTGVLYVLDEPTIGLHPRDNERLNKALKQLNQLGNTMLMVEHDPLTVVTADYILDFGPQGGDAGGYITAQGTIDEILQNENSLTGAYLSQKKTIPIPEKRRVLSRTRLKVKKAKAHNLKNIAVEIPVGSLTCLTGVSGSGKSTLMNQIIKPAIERGLGVFSKVDLEGKGTVSGIENFDKMLVIDQNPIGHTSRSDVCTYVDVLTRFREFFSSLPLSRAKGLQPRHFSYNQRKGMCTNCFGLGYKKVEMFFLPPVKVTCEECKGLRLNPLSLSVTYKGKNLGEYLESTVDEAFLTFSDHPRIRRILDTLISVGLGYLKLGQEMATLSGGEAQRIKLSRELAKRSTGKTLYLLDEPTTGLHSDDIQKLLKVLHRLVDKGNTLIVIEHNMDFIKNGDYLIDLGPEAGERGGEIVGTGTPEELAKNPSSITGKYLRNSCSSSPRAE